MAAGDPYFRGIVSSTKPILQPGSRFSNRAFGLDDGERVYLIHPGLPLALRPKIGDKDAENPGMYITSITPREDESTLIALDVAYRGVSGDKPRRVTPDSDVQMITIPTSASTASSNLLYPLPKPKVRVEYATTERPTYSGLGLPIYESFLPAVQSISLLFVPDPNSLPTINYWGNVWVLDSRTWEEIVPNKLWFVRERYTYYYRLAV